MRTIFGWKKFGIIAVFALVIAQIVVPFTAASNRFNLSGHWYGGDGDCTITQVGSQITITNGATTWWGIINGNTISGNWKRLTYNQKGTFQKFTYDPNYQRGYMERISGIYYIEDKWGRDGRDFYADRKIGK